jgi:phosphatidate cytidylyltransferase
MKRIITGIILGACWLFLLFYESFLIFWLISLIISFIAFSEYKTLSFPEKDNKNTPCPAIFSGLLLPALSYFQHIDILLAGVMGSLIFAGTLTIFCYKNIEDGFDYISKLVFGILYIGIGFSCLILIFALESGYKWLLLLSIITVASDSFAYYSGKTFGKTKLCPAVSPGKTRVGFAGGVAGSILAAILSCEFLFPEINIFILVAVAIMISCLGVIGDLLESIIKRSAGIKDSGNILPGHGGVLDRIDSILLTAPFFFYLLHFKLLNSGQGF